MLRHRPESLLLARRRGRILGTLHDVDMVARGTTDGTWTLSVGARRLGGPDPFEQSLIATARPLLRTLADDLDEDVGLAVPDGDHVRYVDQIRCLHPVQIRDYVGDLADATRTAGGQALLAAAGGATQAVAWTDGDWAEGISGAGVAVTPADGRPVAAINVFGPSYRFPGTRRRDEIDERLLAVAGEIADRLSPA